MIPRGWRMIPGGWPLLLPILGLLALGACGKKGPPSMPGPANEITYPKLYPSK